MSEITADERVKELEEAITYLTEQIKIDKFSLDEEWVKQPQLYHDASDNYAKAISYRDQSKSSLEQCDADISRQIRAAATPETKLTENKIAEAVLLDPNHIKFLNYHLNYKYMADRLKGLVESLAQRADALKDLVRLHNIKYYGTMTGNDPDFEEAQRASIKAHQRKTDEKRDNQTA